MKVKHLSMLAVSSLVAGAAHAYSSSANGLTMYGLVDAGIRYSDTKLDLKRDKSNTALWQLADGGLGGSHWGLRGREELGTGMAAFFTLESSFSTNNGQEPNGTGQLFGRQALVGVEMSGNTLSFGRQYGLALESMSSFNPIGLGKIPATSWHTSLTGVRFDNSVRYKASALAGIDASLMYAFGGKAGDQSRGRMVGASIGYTLDTLTLSAAWQETRDDQRRASRVWSVGGTVTTGPVRLFAGFVDNRLDKGFGPETGATDKALVLSTSGIQADSDKSGRRDRLIIAGLSHKPTSALNLTLGYMQDEVNGVTTPHKHHTVYGVADYSLSPRTGMYLAVDHNRNTKGVPVNLGANDTAGKDRQTGLMVGLRHKF